RCDFRDVSDLAREVAGHEVHVVGEILPGTAYARNLRLASEFAFGSDFAGYAGYFAGKGVELVDHRVDGVYELQNVTRHIYGDFAGEVAACDGGCHFGNVSHLGRKVSSHGIHRVGEILPGSGHAGNNGLSAQFSIGTDFAGHARHFRGERAELIDHRVDG